jgi:hypothetical protein
MLDEIKPVIGSSTITAVIIDGRNPRRDRPRQTSAHTAAHTSAVVSRHQYVESYGDAPAICAVSWLAKIHW